MGYSVEFELLKLLEIRFNFTSYLIDEQRAWGQNLGNGTWTGSVGRVINKEAQLGICMLSHTIERRQVVDYTAHTFIDEVTLLSHSPKEKSKAWLVLAPFDAAIWTIILLTAATLLIRLLKFKINHLHLALPRLPKWYLCPTENTHFIPWRVFYGGALLSILVLNTAYGAAFYALLTLPQFESPIDSLADLFALLTTDQRLIVVYSKVAHIERYLNVSSDPSNYFAPLGTRPRLLVDNLDRLIEAVEEDPCSVTFESRVTLATERYLKARAPLHLASVSFELDQLGWIVQKGSPLVEPFSQMIIRVRETGLYHRWFTRSLAQMPRREGLTWRQLSDDILHSNPTTLRTSSLELAKTVGSLTLASIWSVYYLFSIGMIASALLAMFEFIFKCISKIQ